MNNEMTVTKNEPRTDIHRRGAFQPELYNFMVAYWLGHNGAANKAAREFEINWINSEDARDFQAECPIGDFGKCGVCGARYLMGEIWQHRETMEIVHIGHECADKYGMVSGTDWSAIQDERRRAAKAKRTAALNAKSKARIEAEFPGFVEALSTNHYIVADIRSRFERSAQWITEKQVRLVLKIAADVKAAEAAKAQERHVPAPEGRQTVTGIVVATKAVESVYGITVKMIVKVTTPDGDWLCYGTRPSNHNIDRGDTVTFSATLNPASERREAHFAFFSRPSKVSVVKAGA